MEKKMSQSETTVIEAIIAEILRVANMNGAESEYNTGFFHGMTHAVDIARRIAATTQDEKNRLGD